MDNNNNKKKKNYQNFFIIILFEIKMGQIILFTFVPPCVLTKIISSLIKSPHSPCTFCVLLQVTVYLIQ